MDTTFVALHNNKCLSCGHLVDKAREFHDSCHFTNGNAACPAKNFKIGIGVDQERASQAIAEALHNEDASELLRLATKLNKLNPVVSRSVMSKVFNKYALLNGISVSDIEVEEEPEDEEDDLAGEDTYPEIEVTPVAAPAPVPAPAAVRIPAQVPVVASQSAVEVEVPSQVEASDDSVDAAEGSSDEDDEDEWVS